MAHTRLTLNQILKSFEDFATAHKQIKHFGIGDPWDLNASSNIIGPVMWVTLMPASVDLKILYLNFSIVMGDLSHADHRTEVYSDRLQVALDFVAWLQGEHENLDITTSVQLTPFTESTDHELTGWTITAQVEMPYFGDYCSIPGV